MSEKKVYKKHKEIPFAMEDRDGKEVDYFLRELDGTGRDLYYDKMGKRAKFDMDGKPTEVKSFSGVNIDLLSLCIFDATGKQVSAGIIQGWPISAQDDLFLQAVALSGLDQETRKKKEEEAKNA